MGFVCLDPSSPWKELRKIASKMDVNMSWLVRHPAAVWFFFVKNNDAKKVGI